MKQKNLSINKKKRLLEIIPITFNITNWISSAFEDGDILYIKAIYENIIIFKNARYGQIYRYANLINGHIFTHSNNNVACDIIDIKEMRKATQSEISQLMLELEKRNLEWDSKNKKLIPNQ